MQMLSRSWRPPAAIDGSDLGWPLERLRKLAYVVGVLLKGEGSVYCTRQTRLLKDRRITIRVPRIELKNKSEGFLGAFNNDLSQVLGRNKVKISGPNREGHRMVRYTSKDFVSWWRSLDLAELFRIARAFPSEYLRGRFDSDSNVGRYKICLVGIEKHRLLMEFERSLCVMLGIRAGRIHPYSSVGETTFVSINSKRITSKQPKIRFNVNTRDFARMVGWLNVEWKNRVLQSPPQRPWTPWESGVRKKALELNSAGLSCQGVAEKLRLEFNLAIPYDTVYYWLRRSVLSQN
jgi:intein-encoded DNA endonuclease-like protein